MLIVVRRREPNSISSVNHYTSCSYTTKLVRYLISAKDTRRLRHCGDCSHIGESRRGHVPRVLRAIISQIPVQICREECVFRHSPLSFSKLLSRPTYQPTHRLSTITMRFLFVAMKVTTYIHIVLLHFISRHY